MQERKMKESAAGEKINITFYKRRYKRVEGRQTAQLKINDELIDLYNGDYLFIPAQTPHQVWKTSADTIWLAIHIHPSD